MEVYCESCGVTTSIQQSKPFHAGFSNRGFLYSDTTASILKFNPYDRKYVEIIGSKNPWSLTEEEKQQVEEHLLPCPLGGHYRFGAMPRCPSCGKELHGVVPDDMHFVELGLVVDGEKEQIWK